MAHSLLLFVFWIAVDFSSGATSLMPESAFRRGLFPPPPIIGGSLGVAASKKESNAGGGLHVNRPFSMHS